ncbi:hypothetical protein D3C78_1620510 [compost metagenome]
MSKIETSDWSAIIDRKSVPPVLLVAGIVNAPDKMLAFLVKKVPQGFVKENLLLDLGIVNGIVPVNNPQPVTYTERLDKDVNYQSVEIFYEGERIEIVKVTEYGKVLVNGIGSDVPRG